MTIRDDDPRVLRLADDDGVVMARVALRPGDVVRIDGVEAALTSDVPIGFKLAARHLPTGTTIIRAGVPIGRLTADVRVGDLVHLHNLESLYLRTHARGES